MRKTPKCSEYYWVEFLRITAFRSRARCKRKHIIDQDRHGVGAQGRASTPMDVAVRERAPVLELLPGEQHRQHILRTLVQGYLAKKKSSLP